MSGQDPKEFMNTTFCNCSEMNTGGLCNLHLWSGRSKAVINTGFDDTRRVYDQAELDAAVLQARQEERALGPCRKHPRACWDTTGSDEATDWCHACANETAAVEAAREECAMQAEDWISEEYAARMIVRDIRALNVTRALERAITQARLEVRKEIQQMTAKVDWISFLCWNGEKIAELERAAREGE